MRTFDLFRYSIPMIDGVYPRIRRLKVREGLIVILRDGESVGRGEISPLPDFSEEDLASAEHEALCWLTDWKSGYSSTESTLPSVAFGISCALTELRGDLPQAPDVPMLPNCTGDPDELLEQLAQTPMAEIKIGLYESVRDGMVATLLLESLPTIQLRLSGCQRWNRSKSAGFLKYLNPVFKNRIDYISEPCKTIEESFEFSQLSGLKLALDLSCHPTLFDGEISNLDTVILKPTLIGSVQKCRELIEHAHKLHLRVVIENAFESSLGLSQLAALANQYTPSMPPMLNTLPLMTAQVIQRIQTSPLPLFTVEDLTRIEK